MQQLSPRERLRTRTQSRGFLLSAELECPRSASAANVLRQARAYAPYVTAIDCTDNSAATVRMSPVAAATIALTVAPCVLVQLTCRDRNRLALQSEVLGAAAAGAAGIVCMRGDPPTSGNHPDARGVYDLSTLDLIRMVRDVSQTHAPGGRRAGSTPELIAGCVENPAKGECSVERLAAKVEAGAELVQTQISFDLETLARWMDLVRVARLHERATILVGIAPIRRPAIARYLQEHVEGVTIPDRILRRLDAAADSEAEGVAVAAEVLRACRQIEGLAGAHLMTFGWTDGVRRVAEMA